jgi:hypothetical protein
LCHHSQAAKQLTNQYTDRVKMRCKSCINIMSFYSNPKD